MANSAVVGILKAILEADTATFTAKMNEASDDVKNLGAALQKDLEPRQRAVNAAVRDFLGGKEIQKAEEYAQAIGKLDSINQLVEADQRKVNKVMTEAIAHYTALGQQAPAHFLKIQQETQKTATFTEQLKGQFAGLGPSFLSSAAGFAVGMVSVQALIGGFKALSEFAQDCVKSFLDAESANKKIDASLRATGTYTPTLARQYRQLASDMEAVTVNSDDLNAEAIALFTSFGIGADQMKAALTAASDLASGLNIDLLSAVQLVAKGIEGNDGALKRYNITVKESSDKGEQFANVLEAINSKFGGRALADIESTEGQLKQLANAWDNVKEAIGEVVVQSTAFQLFLKTTQASLKSERQGIDDATAAYARYLEMRQRLGLPVVHGKGFGQDVHLGPEADPEVTRQTKEQERAIKAATDATRKRIDAETDLRQAMMRTFDVFKLPGQRVTLGPSATEIEAVEQLIVNMQLYTALLDEGKMHLKDQEAGIRALIQPSQSVLDVFNKLPGQRITLPDPPDPSKYEAWASDLGVIGGLFGTIGQNATGTFRDITLASGHMSDLVVAHFKAIAVGANTAATAASLAWGVFTLGISVWATQVAENHASVTDFRKQIDELSKSISALGGTPITLGKLIEASGLPRQMTSYADLVKALEKQLADLRGEAEKTAVALKHVGGSEKTWQELEQLAKDLGIDVTKLGTAFDTLKLHDVGKSLAESWGLFKKAGTDNLVVLEGMQDEVNAWLKDVQNAGLKIPESMRPILDAMAKAGLLTDAAGNKLEDLSSLDFEPDLEKGLQDVATGLGDVEGAIRDLISVLTGDLPGAFQKATVEADRWVTNTKRSVTDLAHHIDSELGGLNFGVGVESPSGLEMPTFSGGGFGESLSGGSYVAEAAPSLGGGGGYSTAVLNVNGREFYRTTLPDMIDELKREQVTR